MTWHGCPQELSAINFHPSNLVVLKLSYSFITTEWAGWSQIKVAKKLKVLDLTHCDSMTRTPNFSDYLSLERLNLENCQGLIEVDGSLGKLKCLIYFNSNGCTSLGELPEGIGLLEKLKYLYLGNCKMLSKLPESFARLSSLVELDLSNTTITRLPNAIGNQECLLVLKLQYKEINELPSSIRNLQKLKFLVLSYTKIRELPVSIGNLESLLELDVSETQCLQLPESIGNLSRLKVINISYSLMRELPQHCSTKRVGRATCWELPVFGVGNSEDIWKLSLLRVLHLELSLVRNVPVTIKLLPCLEKLGLCDCNKLELLPELPTSLISLSLGSSSLQWIPDLSNLTGLVNLRYGGHDENWRCLYSLDGPCRQSLPPSLSTLFAQYHESIASSSFHCNLGKLTHLYISHCFWKEVQLDGLEQLIEFEVEGLKHLEGFAGLLSLKRLKLLRLSDCPNLTMIQGLGSVESLKHLEIDKCPKIESLDDLSDLKKLESLVIRGCEELLALKGLDELETLKYLEFVGCISLRSFPNVLNWKLSDECSLTISDCPNLRDDWFEETVSMYKQWKHLKFKSRLLL
ncbi:disease resistance protein RPV1 [Eucalyptus grandis]|uniref:disease resistance protein RPV1 n=1 Tax=Eucalyptus grandis TaxID=71139 RepID=UPI00192EAF24|nr:disease resistance protein RPV1 [Eucalyptus grandis]